MSRIGKLEIKIPQGVELTIKDNIVTVKGKKGQLSQEIIGGITVEKENDVVLVKRPDDHKNSRSYHGLYRSLINNMVVGVSEGFKKTLEINGVGYKAEKQGKVLNLSLGYSHPINFEMPEGIDFVVEGNGRVVTIVGIDKQAVGQIAANIRKLRKPEPYKGKGIKYSDEFIIRKVGKTK
jgi:large subunit ribosomal protein L6